MGIYIDLFIENPESAHLEEHLICWPSLLAAQDLDGGTPSSSKASLPVLRGMAHMVNKRDGNHEPYIHTYIDMC